VRLNKRDLAKKLCISERSLTSWQDAGMPVLEHGRRGQENAYDLAAVLAWIRRTRDPERVGHIPLAQLEREAGLAPAPVQTSALTADQVQALREGLALEAVLLRLPAIAQDAGLADAQIEALLAGVLIAIGEELGAEAVNTWRTMLADERARPGSVTT
jgi:hypothetical protein